MIWSEIKITQQEVYILYHDHMTHNRVWLPRMILYTKPINSNSKLNK